MSDLDLEIQGLLESWGQWVLAEGNGLGYSSPMAALMREQVAEKKKPQSAMFITDDEALRIERVITKLCKFKPLEGKVLILKYVERMSANAIAKHYLTPIKYGNDSSNKVSSYQASQLIANAEGFVAGLMLSNA